VITRIRRRIALPLHFGRGCKLSLILGFGLGLTWPADSEAAKLSRFLTSEDVAGRMLLDQNGEQLEVSATGRHLVIPQGTTPTYMAIPFTGGEHLPANVPSIVAVSEQGETTTGPLKFDAQVKAALNTDLETSKLAILETSSQNYLVEYLPGRGRSGSATGSNAANELTHLLSTGSTQLSKLTQSGVNELDKLLNIKGSQSPTSKPNIEAQVLGSVLPPPIPEPSTWMILAGLTVAAAGLRRRLRRHVMARD
jgi:hypothetical protein